MIPDDMRPPTPPTQALQGFRGHRAALVDYLILIVHIYHFKRRWSVPVICNYTKII